MDVSERKCVRTGICCHHLDSNTGKVYSAKCKHLVMLPSGKSLCRTYKTRLGKPTGTGHYCGMRDDFPFNIPGCGMNKPEWPDADMTEYKQ